MKKIQIAAILALASAGIYAQSAQAATYTSGDLLIGFRSTNGSITTDYVIDVGQSLFAEAASNGGTVTIGNFGTDLGSFDPNWFTDGTTKWGVAGGTLTGDTASTLYAGIAETAVNAPWLATGVPSTYHGRTTTAQNTTIGHFNTVGNAFTNGSLATGSPTGDDGSFGYPYVGVQLQTAGASGTSSWNGQDIQSGGGYGIFAGSFDGTVGSGLAGDNLDLFQITPSVTTPVYEGTLNVSSTGTVTFSAGAVPEPSALMAFAGGAGLLGLIRRRRAVTA